MIVKILKKKKNGRYCYIGKDNSETLDKFYAAKLTEKEATDFVGQHKGDGNEYFIVSC